MRRLYLLLILFAGLIANSAEIKFTPLPLEGQTFIHDPSTIIKEGTNYFIFGTGPGIRTKSSPDLIHWENGGSVFRTPPMDQNLGARVPRFVLGTGCHSHGRKIFSVLRRLDVGQTSFRDRVGHQSDARSVRDELFLDGLRPGDHFE
jgi:hypothetical protein